MDEQRLLGLLAPFARVGKLRRFPPEAVFTRTPAGTIYWRDLYAAAAAVPDIVIESLTDSDRGGIAAIQEGDQDAG